MKSKLKKLKRLLLQLDVVLEDLNSKLFPKEKSTLFNLKEK